MTVSYFYLHLLKQFTIASTANWDKSKNQLYILYRFKLKKMNMHADTALLVDFYIIKYSVPFVKKNSPIAKTQIQVINFVKNKLKVLKCEKFFCHHFCIGSPF